MGVFKYLFRINRSPTRIRDVSSLEAGISLLETVVALGVLGIIAVTFITGVTVTSHAAFITDEQVTSESLAKSQMEWVQNSSYTGNATSYPASPVLSSPDYAGYSANITAAALHIPDDGIQKITVQVAHSGKHIFTLESYKVNR